MVALLWWHWILFGAALVILTKFIPIVSLPWFGLGAIFVGLLVAVFPAIPPEAQLLVFSISSIVFVIVWTRVILPRRQAGANKD
ncbi:NfeD family protein [Geoalkalibacter halelectricus]|uniref:NfeD-like C-terminal, partner-binding n=1 Tax=Geoalkalibacter halelectricus TaxID=2847045 RepID=A0ABY5ZN45_9BACT|nr:hypothetical protein [Geoalkalibacter halelectricus]MDO3379980.1 hypothetical protein [Geoalkalibacter halelectricus]UWZ80493.1 hypothetical protein L9S41_03615 [Geoalkalibacter halelectricus]